MAVLFLVELLRAGAEPQGALRHGGGGGAPGSQARCGSTPSVSDPDWIRIQSGQWIRIRIQEGKNDPQK